MTALRQAEAPSTSGPELAQRIEEAMGILDRVARRLARRYARIVDVDELRAFGRAELLPIVTAWDASRAPFSAWVRQKLEWAMIDGVRRETHGRSSGARAMALVAAELVAAQLAPSSPPVVPSPTSAPEPAAAEADPGARLDRLLATRAAALAVGLLLDAAASRPEAASPEEQATARQAAAHVRAAVAALPERERALVEGVYWHGEALDAVGRRLGISKSWASRMHAQAIERLRRSLGHNQLSPAS